MVSLAHCDSLDDIPLVGEPTRSSPPPSMRRTTTSPGFAAVRLDDEPFVPLAINEAIFRRILRHLPGMSVAIFNLDLVYVFADGEAIYEMGLSPERLVGLVAGQVSGHPTVFEPACRRATEYGEESWIRIAMNGRDYKIHILPFIDESGVIVGGMLVSRREDEKR